MFYNENKKALFSFADHPLEFNPIGVGEGRLKLTISGADQVRLFGSALFVIGNYTDEEVTTEDSDTGELITEKKVATLGYFLLPGDWQLVNIKSNEAGQRHVLSLIQNFWDGDV